MLNTVSTTQFYFQYPLPNVPQSTRKRRFNYVLAKRKPKNPDILQLPEPRQSSGPVSTTFAATRHNTTRRDNRQSDHVSFLHSRLHTKTSLLRQTRSFQWGSFHTGCVTLLSIDSHLLQHWTYPDWLNSPCARSRSCCSRPCPEPLYSQSKSSKSAALCEELSSVCVHHRPAFTIAYSISPFHTGFSHCTKMVPVKSHNDLKFETFGQERSCVIEQEQGENPFLPRCEHVRQVL